MLDQQSEYENKQAMTSTKIKQHGVNLGEIFYPKKTSWKPLHI